ncbi:LPXTG cell wall anchor domain-containing protein, partial [Enterococcus faecalis]|uniref:LPXTG cell wall anchor domain-containing protein n=1 Tax=Enterococcus faecalis TaxID=1351 RepID=UPI003CC5A08B
ESVSSNTTNTESTLQTTTSSSKKATSSSSTEHKKGKFPSTGEKKSVSFTIIGIILLSLVSIFTLSNTHLRAHESDVRIAGGGGWQ